VVEGERSGRGERRVIACGRTVLTSALAASLTARPDLRLVEADVVTPEGVSALADLHPDAVVCDLRTVPPDLVLALLRACPGVLVVAVELDSGHGLAVSSRWPRITTVTDLLGVLAAHAAAGDTASEWAGAGAVHGASDTAGEGAGHDAHAAELEAADR
jgi:hypothetical protein